MIVGDKEKRLPYVMMFGELQLQKKKCKRDTAEF